MDTSNKTLSDLFSEDRQFSGDRVWCEIESCDGRYDPEFPTYEVALTVARRVYTYGFPELVEAMESYDPGEGIFDCILTGLEHLDEDLQDSMCGYACETFWVKTRTGSSGVDQNLLKLLLEGRISEMNAPSTRVLYNLFMTIGVTMGAKIHYCEGNRDSAFTILMKRMQTETICQRRLASDILSKFFERKKVPSFGWYAIRRVWFPAWKVSNYMWKVSGESSCAEGGDARMRHMEAFKISGFAG